MININNNLFYFKKAEYFLIYNFILEQMKYTRAELINIANDCAKKENPVKLTFRNLEYSV